MDGAGERIYSYDANGYLDDEQRIVNGITYITEYDFDPAGNLRAMVYPTGQVVEYLPSATDASLIGAVRLNAGSGFQTLAGNLAYKPFGPLAAMTLGNSIQQTKGFDHNYQIATLVAGSVLSLTFTPDNAGNIAAITNNLNPARNQSFGYDALNRLTSAGGIHGTQGFTYDRTGNRRTATDDGIQDIYSFVPGTNRLDTITGSQTINFDHDSRGNLIGRTYVTGSGPTGSQNPDYTYTHDGQRISKTIGTQTTVYHYDLYGQLIAETTASGDPIKAYIYLHGQPLAQIGPTGTVSYYHNDHLGTPQRMTDAGGTLVWSADYLPFGAANVTVATVENNLRFPGQYYDSETGLHYNYQRFYDPKLGRYLTPDPIGLAGGINLYSYVQNNPLMFIDPFGLCLEDPEFLLDPVNYLGGLLAGGIKSLLRKGTTEVIKGALSAGARTEARNLAEQLTMEEARAGAGQRIMQGSIDDARFPANEWAKMQNVHTTPDGQNIVIHYWERLVDGFRTGFKFKE